MFERKINKVALIVFYAKDLFLKFNYINNILKILRKRAYLNLY